LYLYPLLSPPLGWAIDSLFSSKRGRWRGIPRSGGAAGVSSPPVCFGVLFHLFSFFGNGPLRVRTKNLRWSLDFLFFFLTLVVAFGAGYE